MQQDSCNMCWWCLPNSGDITRGLGNFLHQAGEKSRMCEVHGGADRSSRRDLPRKARKYVSDHALELILPVLMPPRACAVHARHTHARRWHRMGDKCTPAAPNQLLTGVLALLMQSLCLFRLNPADNAACAPRYTAAQSRRTASPASPRMLQKGKFAPKIM